MSLVYAVSIQRPRSTRQTGTFYWHAWKPYSLGTESRASSRLSSVTAPTPTPYYVHVQNVMSGLK